MPIYLLGEQGGPPFDRTFFRTTLEAVLERAGKDASHRFLLFLADGSSLDVCRIDEVAENYLALRAYDGEDASCEMTVHLLPYGLIYRIELGPKEDDNHRVGFKWVSPKPSQG